MPIKKNPRTGSALLIAILLMSVLILITVGLSRLVSSETRQIGEMIRNGSAEYLAEGGSELGQLIFYNIEEGSEAIFDGLYQLDITDQNGPTKQIKFNLQGTTNHIPIRSQTLFQAYKTTPTDQIKTEFFQNILPGESIEIFLNDQQKNQGFEIQYYLPTVDSDALGRFQQEDFDVLLFKLSGEQTTKPNEYAIDFITEYFPAKKSVGSPSILSNKPISGAYQSGTFFEYSDGTENQALEPIFTEEGLTFSNYQEAPTQNFDEFLNKHNKNVITLTNAVNLNFISAPSNINDISNYNQILEQVASIYFRACSPSCQIAENENANPNTLNTNKQPLISPFILIESQGIFASTTKNFNLQLNRPNALSVFNFALYNTDT